MSLASDIKALVGDESIQTILMSFRPGLFVLDGDADWIVVARDQEFAKIVVDPHYGWGEASKLSLAQVYDVQAASRQGTRYWVPTDIQAL